MHVDVYSWLAMLTCMYISVDAIVEHTIWKRSTNLHVDNTSMGEGDIHVLIRRGCTCTCRRNTSWTKAYVLLYISADAMVEHNLEKVD